jgi:hypothetical protein
MHIKRSTAGRKEDVREKCTRMIATALNDNERHFLARLAEGLAAGLPIRIGNEEWVVERAATPKTREVTDAAGS